MLASYMHIKLPSMHIKLPLPADPNNSLPNGFMKMINSGKVICEVTNYILCKLSCKKFPIISAFYFRVFSYTQKKQPELLTCLNVSAQPKSMKVNYTLP